MPENHFFRAAVDRTGTDWGLVQAWSALVSLAALFNLAGCGGDTGPIRVPVSGQIVMADGKPVFPGSIAFVPQHDTGFQASTLLQEQGKFTLRTYPFGEGVVPDEYIVVLSLGMGSPPELAKYASAGTSPLKVTVPAEGLPDLKLELPEKMEAGKPRGGPPGMAK